MKSDAKEPFKIYAYEVFKDERGTQRITPDAFLRLSRALEEAGSLSRDSSPRLAVVSRASLNGGSHGSEAEDNGE
jgi:hypothetical protein